MMNMSVVGLSLIVEGMSKKQSQLSKKLELCMGVVERILHKKRNVSGY
jgi:hypothetical protein